jgi:hypothetical protein
MLQGGDAMLKKDDLPSVSVKGQRMYEHIN